MEAYDFNLHLPPDGDFAHELDFSLFDPVASVSAIRSRLAEVQVTGGNVMILDGSWLRNDPQPLLDAVTAAGLQCTALIDPRAADAVELVDAAHGIGVRGIKFHAYFQGLTDDTFAQAVTVAERAAKRSLWIAVCCSYGTRRVYDVSGMRLLAALSQTVTTTPLVCLHAGGRLVLDAMSIALDASNVFLETSFSIPFWLGSSVETDFVFALRKMGVDRWIYGSDHPHVELAEAKDATLSFLTRHGFSDREVERVFGDTARAELVG